MPANHVPKRPVTLGLSIHHLATVFQRDVLAQDGLSEDSTFYDIEDLNSKNLGIVRRKGSTRICPHDGSLGAAYVDCLEGEDHVGPATHMLSWTWSYTISDVVQTLLDYCMDNNTDPKRTYVWICILCINQHRVVKCSKSGILDSEMVDFESQFRSRVLEIGNVLVMMVPWQDPLYLKRIWCIFEFFTATSNQIPISIIVPHRETTRMTNELIGKEGRGVDALYATLQGIDIQQACASVEEDKIRILRLVEESAGFNNVNRSVGEHFRSWVKGILERIVAAHLGKKQANSEDQLSLSSVWYRLGKLFTNIGDHKLALSCYEKALGIRKSFFGINHLETAAVFERMGSAYYSRGNIKKAHEMYYRCLSIRESKLGKDHPLTALSYRSIGRALASFGENDYALAMFRKCQVIQESIPGKDLQSIAETYNEISALLQRRGQHQQAISMQKRAVTITVAVSGTRHPRTANAYISLGNICIGAGSDYYDEALPLYRKSLEIRDNTLGRSHPETAASLYSLGLLLMLKQDYSEALPVFRRCQELQEKYLDPVHPHTALTCSGLASTLASLGELDEALRLYTKAERIQRILFSENHPSTIKTRYHKEQTALKRSSWSEACCYYMNLPFTFGWMVVMWATLEMSIYENNNVLVVSMFLTYFIIILVIRYARMHFVYQCSDTIMALPEPRIMGLPVPEFIQDIFLLGLCTVIGELGSIMIDFIMIDRDVPILSVDQYPDTMKALPEEPRPQFIQDTIMALPVPRFIQYVFLFLFRSLKGVLSSFIIGYLVIRYGQLHFFHQHPDTIMALPVPKFIQEIFLVTFLLLFFYSPHSGEGVLLLFVICLVMRFGRMNFFRQHPDTIMALPMADQDYPTTASRQP